jgi:putative ABC transport system permease protein
MIGKRLLFSIALRIFKRDWRRDDLLNLIFSMAIAMASVSVIYLIIDRVESATNQQASQMLGADLVITSPKPIDTSWLDKSKEQNLTRAEIVEFVSVLSANDQLQLSAVKAISDNYPLKGRIEIADTPYDEARVVSGHPSKGQIWIEPRILTVLNAQKGQKLELGYTDLEIDGTIMLQPGQGSTLFNIAPTAIIGLQDLAATKVIQPGSRVTYRYLFVGEKNNIAAFEQWIKPQLDTSQRLVTVFDESPMAGSAISRSKKYISLSGLLTLILLGVAIAMSANRYATRQFDMSALMRCFGMNNNQVLSIFLIILLMVSLVGIGIGALLGLFFQSFMVNWLAELFGENLPPADISVLLLPMLTSFILLLGFAMPSLIQLKSVPPMRVLRRQLEPMKASAWSIYGLAAISMIAVMYVQMQDIKLLASVFAGLLFMAAIFALLSKLFTLLIRRLSVSKNAAINYSLRQLDANKGVTMLHLLAFSSTVFVIALVVIIRTELMSKWQQSLAEDAPNHFMVNIAAEDAPEIDKFLSKNKVKSTETYPMVRGRVVQINHQDIKDVLSEKALQHNSLKRELNMTWTAALPKGNKVVAGQWGWSENKTDPQGSQNSFAELSHEPSPELSQRALEEPKSSLDPAQLIKLIHTISIEDKMADTLGLKLGDSLTFKVGDESWSAQITSFRSIDWQTFTPNFYIIADPGSLNAFAPTYINSFYLAKDKKKLVTDLTNQHPTAIIIELDRIFEEIRQIINKVSSAIELIMVFVVGAGFALLWAAMEHTFSQKLHQSAILRTLGASRRFIATSFRFEFLWLAILSSFVAISCIELVSYFLYRQIFNIEFEFHFALWWQLPVGLFLMMMLASWRGVNRVTTPAPLSLLK